MSDTISEEVLAARAKLAAKFAGAGVSDILLCLVCFLCFLFAFHIYLFPAF